VQVQLRQAQERASGLEAESARLQQENARLQAENGGLRQRLQQEKLAFGQHLKAAQTALAGIAAAGGSAFSLVPD
jgi:regulator of replication initiation timing